MSVGEARSLAKLDDVVPESGPLSLPRAAAGVRIRAWQEADLDRYAFWLRPHQDWYRWDAPYEPALTAQQLRSVEEHYRDVVDRKDGWDWPEEANSGPVRRAGVADARTDELVGTVSWYRRGPMHMGVSIYDPDLRGLGHGTRALKLWADYLFSATTQSHLCFATWSGNMAMLAVGRKLGFAPARHTPRRYVVNGRFYHSVVMAVAREQWCSV